MDQVLGQLTQERAREILDLPEHGPISHHAIETAIRHCTYHYQISQIRLNISEAEKQERSQQMMVFLYAARAKLYEDFPALPRDLRPAPSINPWPLPVFVTSDSFQSEPLAHLSPGIHIISIPRYRERPEMTWRPTCADHTRSTNYANDSVFQPDGYEQFPDTIGWAVHRFYEAHEDHPLRRYRMAWNCGQPDGIPPSQQNRFDNFKLSMQIFEAHFHTFEPNRLQPWHRQDEDDNDFPHIWTDRMTTFMVQTLNPSIFELLSAWRNGRNIGDLWSGLGALHCYLIQFKGIHAMSATRPFIWSFTSNPDDFKNEPPIQFTYPESAVPKTIYGLEGGPNPERCSFRDVAIHTGVIERMDNVSFHCASKGFAEAMAKAIYGSENQGMGS